MKATIDLPEILFRETKVKAALEGTTVRAVVIRALEREIHDAKPAARQRRVQLPLITLKKGSRVRSLTNAEIDALSD